jgi:uncharacterized protein
MVVFRIVVVLLLLACANTARADFAAGLAAYERGDFETAYTEWLRLAEGGDAEAQFRVGRLYDVGEGRPRNGPNAVEWYEKSYRQGDLKAGHNLGFLYDVGEIVSQDYSLAFDYYLNGANRNHPKSQLNLGLMYMGGHGVKRDFAEAYMWFFLAVRSGEPDGSKAIEYFKNYTTEIDRSQGEKAHWGWMPVHSQ